jgi:hypothetical protein
VRSPLSRFWGRGKGAVYLDLEEAQDWAKLADPAANLSRHAGKLIVFVCSKPSAPLVADLMAQALVSVSPDICGEGGGESFSCF